MPKLLNAKPGTTVVIKTFVSYGITFEVGKIIKKCADDLVHVESNTYIWLFSTRNGFERNADGSHFIDRKVLDATPHRLLLVEESKTNQILRMVNPEHENVWTPAPRNG